MQDIQGFLDKLFPLNNQVLSDSNKITEFINKLKRGKINEMEENEEVKKNKDEIDNLIKKNYNYKNIIKLNNNIKK